MPEPAAWRYDKITKPMFDVPRSHVVLTGRVLTMAGDVIQDGFVEIKDGSIVGVGVRSELDAGTAEVEETGGTIMPGLINSHAHLNWDGIHDLARQSMDDARPISAFKAAGNMLKSLRAGVTMVRDLGLLMGSPAEHWLLLPVSSLVGDKERKPVGLPRGPSPRPLSRYCSTLGKAGDRYGAVPLSETK